MDVEYCCAGYVRAKRVSRPDDLLKGPRDSWERVLSCELDDDFVCFCLSRELAKSQTVGVGRIPTAELVDGQRWVALLGGVLDP